MKTVWALYLCCLNLSEEVSIQSQLVILFSINPPVVMHAWVPFSCFCFLPLVKPHPPRLLVEFENSVTNFAFVWHDEVRAQHCRIRYRPLTGYTWNTVILCWRMEEVVILWGCFNILVSFWSQFFQTGLSLLSSIIFEKNYWLLIKTSVIGLKLKESKTLIL